MCVTATIDATDDPDDEWAKQIPTAKNTSVSGVNVLASLELILLNFQEQKKPKTQKYSSLTCSGNVTSVSVS